MVLRRVLNTVSFQTFDVTLCAVLFVNEVVPRREGGPIEDIMDDRKALSHAKYPKELRIALVLRKWD